METAQYNELNVATLSTEAQRVEVQVGVTAPASSASAATPPPTLQATAATLASQPGMAWMAQLQSDPALQDKVDWNAVTLAHEGWDYEQQGLTQEGAAIVTLVVAYFTAGAASGVGTTAGNAAAVSVGEGVALSGGGTFVAATGTATTVSSVVAGAVTAGVSALASQAAVAVLNNQGDLGHALDDLGSSDSIKGLVSAVITGGVLGGLNMTPTGGATPSGGASPYLTQLGQNLQAGAARAVVNSAIYGTSLEDNLQSAIQTALIDTTAAQTAFSIGSTWEPASTANLLAHAIAGCAAGAARSGDCSAGAIGAAVGELAASQYDPNQQRDQTETVQFASMVAGIAAAVAGGDAAAVSTAAAAGGNAAANNWLATQQVRQYRAELAAATSLLDQARVEAKWFLISGNQNVLTAGGIGLGLAESGWSDVKAMAGFLTDPVAGLDGLRQLVTSSEVRQQLTDSAFAELDARISRMTTALQVGGDEAAVQLGQDIGALAWQVGSVLTGAAGTARAATALAEVGISVGSAGLDAMRVRAAVGVVDEGATVAPTGTPTATTAVSDAALAEANFAGGVPVRPRDGTVAAGTAVTETPLGRHLIEAQVVGTGKNASISGGHNMDNFNATVQQAGGTVTSRIEVAPGIYEVRYQLPGGKDQPKTVYDPTRYSDVQMANMASEAAARGIVQYGVTGNPRQFVEVNGVTFLVPIRVPGSNYSATQAAQPYVPTAYPVNPREVNP